MSKKEPKAVRFLKKLLGKKNVPAIEKRDSFCILPFNHLHIAPSGIAKICCISQDPIKDEHGPLSLYKNTYEAIWNSKHMQEIRRAMLSDEPLKQCSRCYHEEEITGTSRRTVQTGYWLGVHNTSVDELKRQMVVSNFQIEKRPGYLQLNMGTQCNLKCRMCSATYSSKIAIDPVFSKWAPDYSTLDIGQWKNHQLCIAPRAIVGIQYEGFYNLTRQFGGKEILFTKGQGKITIPIVPGTVPDAIEFVLSEHNPSTLPLSIRAHKTTLFKGVAGDLTGVQTLSLSALPNNIDSLTLEFISDTYHKSGYEKRTGIGIESLIIHRKVNADTASLSEKAFSRFVDNGAWFEQPLFLYHEMLKTPEDIRHIIFQGGEPLLIKQTEDIIDYLIQCQVAHQVELELVTNATILKPSVMEKLAHFKKVYMGCSIDGIESDYEYIRFPAKWESSSFNIERMRTLPNAIIQFNVAVQMLNLMKLTKTFAYCDARNIDMNTHFLMGPEYLSVLVLPPAAREVAMDRLKDYLAHTPDSHNKERIEYILTYLEKHRDVFYNDHRLQNFMLFTNDMDIQNGHQFKDFHPDLIAYFEEAGFPWNDATMYAKKPVELILDSNQPALSAV